MQRWQIWLEYDGSAFCGWQRQAAGFSVQQCLETAIEKFCGHPVVTHVAGRTDAGVHALGQVVHVDLEKEYTPKTIRDAINFHARPHPLAAIAAAPVAESFHARFDAVQRGYRYLILNRGAPSVIAAGRAWHVPKKLDLAAIQAASHLLLGQHDFSSFRAQFCQANSPIRTLDYFEWQQHGPWLVADIRARSFLYRQVRNMVGTLVMVGLGQITHARFGEILAAANRQQAGPTAPPEGLYLSFVRYADTANIQAPPLCWPLDAEISSNLST